jgi:hypothetical protein
MEILPLILGGVGGFFGGVFVNTITMKVSFKQRTIDNKIKVYDALITQWVKMRNFLYAHHPGQPFDNYPKDILLKFDEIYGESQRFIAEAFLVCDDDNLTADINRINEKFFRSEWEKLSLKEVSDGMDRIKDEAMLVVARMREDIKSSSRLEWRDLSHILSGLGRR